eukprot:CAMPEP_0194759098 /NCGR_PEP_ID=MMETSP0323_2-20130528/12214_1 /TAXON_ID=2866 ORGANISM="Crypthecodinium cohnii, Strain Seligo" /NCGR_SAMPLE_ID=MMETSP0323_2 /ASSEMBLY_ACC=CAM_ASM_000346 /LENGTH=33 /DNA_ID= /DNA_START= /DNA_END= /DNA_ORIENTATION=
MKKTQMKPAAKRAPKGDNGMMDDKIPPQASTWP